MTIIFNLIKKLQSGSSTFPCKTRRISDRFFECKVKRPNPNYCEHSLNSGDGFICNHQDREAFTGK